MQKVSHIFVSAGIVGFIFSLFLDPIMCLVCCGIALIFGGVNDYLDFTLKIKHRNWVTHSLLSPILIIELISLIVVVILQLWWVAIILITTIIAWISHVLLDSITKTGVQMFLPGIIVKGKLSFDDRKWNLIFTISGLGLLILGSLILYLRYWW